MLQKINLRNQNTRRRKKRNKSFWRFLNIFKWGCKGKGKVSVPQSKKPRPAKFKPGSKLGERDYKSANNANSHIDDFMNEESSYKPGYVKPNNNQSVSAESEEVAAS